MARAMSGVTGVSAMMTPLTRFHRTSHLACQLVSADASVFDLSAKYAAWRRVDHLSRRGDVQSS